MTVPDILCLLGIGIASYGLWLIHPSAMYIAVGTSLVAFGVYRVTQGSKNL